MARTCTLSPLSDRCALALSKGSAIPELGRRHTAGKRIRVFAHCDRKSSFRNSGMVVRPSGLPDRPPPMEAWFQSLARAHRPGPCTQRVSSDRDSSQNQTRSDGPLCRCPGGVVAERGHRGTANGMWVPKPVAPSPATRSQVEKTGGQVNFFCARAPRLGFI